MKELFYQNYAELDLPNSSFKKVLGRDELRAINLHPVKEPSYMFRLDNFFNNATLQVSWLPRNADLCTGVGIRRCLYRSWYSEVFVQELIFGSVCKELVFGSDCTGVGIQSCLYRSWYSEVFLQELAFGGVSTGVDIRKCM